MRRILKTLHNFRGKLVYNAHWKFFLKEWQQSAIKLRTKNCDTGKAMLRQRFICSPLHFSCKQTQCRRNLLNVFVFKGCRSTRRVTLSEQNLPHHEFSSFCGSTCITAALHPFRFTSRQIRFCQDDWSTSSFIDALSYWWTFANNHHLCTCLTYLFSQTNHTSNEWGNVFTKWQVE